MVSPPVHDAGGYELAAQTRFYYPANRRERSSFHIWLMSLDGRERRRVSHYPAASAPVWIDRDHLAWTESRGNTDLSCVLSLPSLRRRVVARWSEPQNDGMWLGENRFSAGGRVQVDAAFVKDRDGGYVRWHGGRYRVVNPKIRWKVSMTADGMWPFSLSDLDPWETRAVVVAGTPLVGFGCDLSAHDAMIMLVRLDPKSMTARIVPIDANAIQVRGGRFVAVSNRRIETFGDLGLWTSSVFVGEAPSLRYRRLRLPFGYTVHATLRPEARREQAHGTKAGVSSRTPKG